jgi:hypothetical protein
MFEEEFKRTNLWRSTIGSMESDEFESCRSRLRNEFLKCRDRAKHVVAKTSSVLPGLTVHDISHIDSLWRVADLIVGPNYPLNPVEGFVMGLSFIFHDSAMCWEVYENGCEGVRSTIEWQDAYANECDAHGSGDDDERKSAADFAALRALHALQAGVVVDRCWTIPDIGDRVYLIDDSELRIDVGPIVGQIAASHHKDIECLSEELGGQQNAPRGFPAQWSIDPVKIACILRCADAAHINQSRAPLFLYALIKRNGISGEHWKFQNRMSGPSIDCGDLTERTIVYTSSRPFKESDAAAWWVAYDAVQIVAQEVDESNKLLRCRNRLDSPEFSIKKVKGVDSIDEMVECLRVDGWMPCNAKPHISNVELLVGALGAIWC